MRTFMQKKKPAQPTRSAIPITYGLGIYSQNHQVHAILHSHRSTGNYAAPRWQQSNAQEHQARRASGEMAEGALNQGEEWLPATGDGGSPTDAGVPLPAGVPPAPAAAATPRLKKTTVSALATRNNGGFTWGVRWSIDNATTATNGWIVQHVVVRQKVEAWHPPLKVGYTRPIVPGEGGYGGLRTTWYPLWEAWQVRGGRVFVGSSTSAHNADTYGQGPVGADTKGQTEVVGRADFYPNLTLPVSFTVRNAAPAWALPVTNADPKLTGGTGVLDHNLTATWDGVGGTGATTATTV